MSRVLVLVDNELNGDNRVLREIDLLKNEGHEVKILCYDHGNARVAERKDLNIERISISKGLKDKLLPLVHRAPFFHRLWIKYIKKEILGFKPNIILAHDLYMSYPAKKSIKESGQDIRLVLDLHENFPQAVKGYNWSQGAFKNWLVKPEKWETLEGEYLNMADKIITLHDSFKKDLSSRHQLNEDRFVVFPNIPDLEKFKSFSIDKNRMKSELSNPIMFYFGFVAERRGIFDSLEAFEEVIKEDDEINYLIIGPVDKADQARFHQIIIQEKFKGRIQHIPWIEVSDLPTYLEAVDFCVAPFEVNAQHESGVANKIFQYMYGKKPVIVSNNRPQADIATRYNCGKVYTTQKEFVKAIKDYSTEKKERMIQGNNGYQALINDYNIENLKMPFLDVFRSLI